MISREDLGSVPSDRLHDQAIGFARANGDLEWLWRLLCAMPTTDAQVDDLEDSGMDVARTVSAINGCVRADHDLTDTLRDHYVDYLVEQQE